MNARITVIYQEQQTLGVVVDPAHRVETGPFLRQQITHRTTIRGVAAGTEITARLVQGDIEFAFGFDPGAVHGDAVARRIHLRSQHLDDLAVYSDASGKDDCLARA